MSCKHNLVEYVYITRTTHGLLTRVKCMQCDKLLEAEGQLYELPQNQQAEQTHKVFAGSPKGVTKKTVREAGLPPGFEIGDDNDYFF